MLGRLHARRDLIVMDNRGTGRSGAINCPRLQAGKGVYAREVGRCARRLGRRANAYGTGAAADDLAAVLDKLGVQVVNVYGDSYGTYFAQAFAVRHPDRVRAVVLDAAFAVDGFDPWARGIGALRFAWPETAAARPAAAERTRSPSCAAGRFDCGQAGQGRSRRDADGARHRIRLDGAALGQMVGDGSYYPSLYRDLLAALRALGRGDRAPFLRLAAEDLPFTGGGPVHSYSEGAYAAVACHDYPTLWDPGAPVAMRRAQLAAARAAIAEDAFAPFPKRTGCARCTIDQLVTGCLHWPSPRYPDPPVPPGASYPDTPVLVLDGDLDAITPLGDSRRAAALFPNADARLGPQHGARDGAGGLRRLRLWDRAPLPGDALARRRRLRRADAGGPRGPGVPAPARGAPGARAIRCGRPLDRGRPARRLGGGPDGRRRAGPLVEHVRVAAATACAAAASRRPASTSPTAPSGCA